MINIIHIAHASTEAAAEAQNTGVLAMFGLNLKLFIAQLINFSIVVFVLWKWVFRPVAKGMEERSVKIDKSLRDAAKIAEEKQALQTKIELEISKAHTRASDIMEDARKEGEVLKTKILTQAKQQEEKIIQQTQDKLKAEQQKAITEVKGEIAGLVVAASEKILKAKLDGPKDKELIRESLKEIAK